MHGDVDADLAAAIVGSLSGSRDELLQRTALHAWPERMRAALGKWVGMLALHFDQTTDGWLIALRPEQIELVLWAGRPEKTIAHGPLGPRLTPRGSFDEWRETVRGSAEMWEHTYVIIARQLLAEMHRASMARHAEMDRARGQLLAMLGHDLRDPLHCINMAATVLELGGQPGEIGQRIKASSGRMERLIAQVLDMSRINGGIGLGISRTGVDLVAVINDVIGESRTAYPGAIYQLALPDRLMVHGDVDRLSQVISNLVSNARNHGHPMQPIRISLHVSGTMAVLQVRNASHAIDAAVAATLYAPFKPASVMKTNNRGGMGLGLYIVKQIVVEHDGHIAYSYDSPDVVFTVSIPLGR